MSTQAPDGFIAITEDRKTGTTKFCTHIPTNAASVASLAALYKGAHDAGFDNNDFNIVCDGDHDRIVVSAVVNGASSQRNVRGHLHEFTRIIREAGVMLRPMICPLRVPVMQHQL